MDSLYLLIPTALVFVAIAVKLLLWAIDSGQYDDLDKEAWRILAEDEPQVPSGSEDKAGVENDGESGPSPSN